MQANSPDNLAMTATALAQSYYVAVHAADRAAVAGEEEAQLTTPVSNLFVGLVAEAQLGQLALIRETRLDRTRPDFAALLTRAGKTVQKGYVELKAPDVSVVASSWTGRNARQWERMRHEAEILVICNGTLAQLYRDGEAIGESADLPYQDPLSWDATPLVRLLGRFLDLTPSPIVAVTDLSRRLATRTADLRDRLLWLLDGGGGATEAAQGAYAAWQAHVYLSASERDFADGISQVIAYGMVLAALSGSHADADNDGHITVAESRTAIRTISPVIAAAFAPLLDKPVLYDAVRVELGALETLISAIDPDRINRSADRRGDPWLYFYEDFLEVYDAAARREAGVYYTPVPVVQAMSQIVDYLLVERFDKRLGFADPGVFTLDPAAGTGTFPLAVVERAVTRATRARGAAGAGQAASNLARNLFAFELLPGPYSVAHLRLTQRLRELTGGEVAPAQVVLTDTLESPFDPRDQRAMFGDAEVLAAEQNRAASIKLDQRVTVVIGNPPYRRVERDLHGRGSGGWVIHGRVPGREDSEKSLFDDILDVAREHTIFSHHASLYNLYVYFWRWALWKAFQAHGAGPGVVAFITASSWLTGPGFVGLRELARKLADDIWVIDLGGDNHGSNPEENVFAIETPVAVVVLSRADATDETQPAAVHYRRISGTADEKLRAMAALGDAADPLGDDWLTGPVDWRAPFVPATGDVTVWEAMPLLTDLFPWQQPGCKFGRTWPIAPSKQLLEERWAEFVRAPTAEKPLLFTTGKFGRDIETKVGDLPRLSTLNVEAPSRPIVRYGYRSFDRQWSFDDPRLAALERPSLWKSRSDHQLFFASLLNAHIGAGPALTLTSDVPDLHFFRGSFGGKDIIPLFRDAHACEPNITRGLLAMISERLNIDQPLPESLAAYVYALLSGTAYQQRFHEELRTPGLRVPLTADSDLWHDAVRMGRELIWLHSYAERLRDPDVGHGRHVPAVEGVGWDKAVTAMPATPAAISYDEETHTLTVGTGRVGGVRPDVWAYSISGMPVLRKWLGYRTASGAGKATSSKSPLDRIRPNSWPDEWNDELLDLVRVLTLTLDRQEALSELLHQILTGPLIGTAEIPHPLASERQPPAEVAPMQGVWAV